jgi:hypothetical protein
MYMINHFLDIDVLDTGILISDPEDAPTTNSVNSYVKRLIILLAQNSFNCIRITADAAGCTQFAAGRAPNFVLLDFVNLGQGLQAANQLNGL